MIEIKEKSKNNRRSKLLLWTFITIVATVVLSAILLTSCSFAKISYTLPDGYNRNDVYYPRGEENSCINDVSGDFLGDECGPGYLISGDRFLITSSINDNYSDDTELTLYVFPYNDTCSWYIGSAVLVITGDNTTGYMHFRGKVPDDIDSGVYAFVITDEDLNVVCAFERFIRSKVDLSETYPVETCAKPVIYLYPEDDMECYVSLNLNGYLTCSYPTYNESYGWHIIAHPDGRISGIDVNRDYDYLYWEAECNVPNDFNNSICVRGDETAQFLESYLESAGLTYSEIDDFITYWLPRMEDNPYNLISFLGEEYEDMAELTVSPSPDNVIRVYMVYMPLEEEMIIPNSRQLVIPEPVERTGFTVVEWGGTRIDAR